MLSLWNILLMGIRKEEVCTVALFSFIATDTECSLYLSALQNNNIEVHT